MQLFFLGEIDLSSFIINETYSVNIEDVYNAWTDGNGTNHRDIYRTRISGEFKMKFYNPDRFIEFLEALSSLKTSGGYYPITCYVNNLGRMQEINVYMDFDNTIDRNRGELKDVESFSVKIEEI